MPTVYKVFKITFFATIIFYLTSCSPALQDQPSAPEAVNGVLDLRDWDFEENGSISLSGEWKFFWNALIAPEQAANQQDTVFADVPNSWTNYEIGKEALPSGGYATYSLKLYLPKSEQAYGLYNEGQGSAYTLWIDGEILGQQGQVSTNENEMIPDTRLRTIFFEPEGEATELVIQISNFHHRKGGFRNALLVGPADMIHRDQLQNWFFEAFAVGILFAMGLYHLFLYIYRTKNKATLYFALMCWLSALRIGVTNQSTLLFYLPSISWEMGLRLEYLSFFLAPVPFFLFLKTLYPKDIHSWFVKIAVVIGIGFTVFLALADTLTLSYSSTYYQFVYITYLGYAIFFLARILIKRRTGATYIAVASLIVFSAVIIETLILQNIIPSIYITNFLPIGEITAFSFLAFIFVQAILLANLFSRSFSQVETLSEELEESNINLEQSERKYRTLFEDSKDIIFIVDTEGHIEDINPACVDVLGYTKEEVIQMTLYDIIVDPADSHRFRKTIRTQGFVRNFESQLRCRNGDVIHTLVGATARLDENGKLIGVQGNVHDITARKQAEKLEQIAITDPLTKIYNRRFFAEEAEREIERAKRNKSSLALLFFDIDHFKEVNDSYGHLIGDKILINLVELCQRTIRNTDLFARFGGEEFVILMPETNLSKAKETAERLRKEVAQKPIANAGVDEISITVSIGIAEWSEAHPTQLNILLDQADKSLYRSKETGRNRVSTWQLNE